jgi:S-adenosyl-L-methionine hydrolase (adenosine-forming)
MAKPIITLLTDFGARDAYVASMKGVILGLNPAAVLVDLTHEVPPQDLRAGALVLAAAAPYFPPGTIHLAVVDPGVGSARRTLAVRACGQYLVGPDNGLFHLLLARCPDPEIVSLEEPGFFRPRVAPTFHGRDLFAPVAAHLSLGVELAQFGPAVTDPVLLEWPQPGFGPETVRGEIIHVDHFGNLVSNVPAADLKAWTRGGPLQFQLGAIHIRGLSRTYTDVAPGDFLALAGSHGYLEIACARGNAALQGQLQIGQIMIISKD